MVLAALDQIYFTGEKKVMPRVTHVNSHSKSSLLVFNGLNSNYLNQEESSSWVIYGEYKKILLNNFRFIIGES